MKVLSLFDGISCGRVALERAGIHVSEYYASEIDKNAIKVSEANWPEIKQVGDVTSLNSEDFDSVDLLMGGSPCQGFSSGGKGLNFEDPRSRLFFEFVRLKNEIKPKFWLLENVGMKKEFRDRISDNLCVEPVFINSSDFSAQIRKRWYWTNIPIMKWSSSTLTFGDISQSGDLSKYKVKRTKSREVMWGDGIGGKCPNLKPEMKSRCLTTKQDRWGNAGLIEYEDFCRYLTPIECERLQTLPDDYTSCVSDTHRYACLGNGWTVDVISHILKGMTIQEV